MGSSFIATCVDRNALYVTRLTPAVQLIERVEASFQIGRVARIAVLRAQVIEDLRLEILQPQVAEADAAGTTRAEHHVALSELGPFAEEPRGFENRGQTTFSAISPRKSKTWSVPGFHYTQ